MTSFLTKIKENVNLSSEIFAIKLKIYHAKKPCHKLFEGLRYMKTHELFTLRIRTKNTEIFVLF